MIRTPLRMSLSFEECEYVDKSWSPVMPVLHTAEEGDYQRWYAQTERTLEEKFENKPESPPMGRGRLVSLSQKLSSRQPKDINEVLKLLSDVIDEMKSNTTVLDTLPSPRDEEEDNHGTLRKAFRKYVPTLWKSPLPDADEACHENSVIVLLCRARVIMSDLVIGALLIVKEKLTAHCIFWRWVEMHPKLYASTSYAKSLIQIFHKLEQAIDIASGLVHTCAARVGALTETDSDLLRGAIFEVSCVNKKLLDELTGGAERIFKAPKRQVKSLISEECVKKAHSLDTSRFTLQDDNTVIHQMLTELETVNSFPKKLLDTIDSLYTQYYYMQLGTLMTTVSVITTVVFLFHRSGKWAKILKWWSSTKVAWGEFIQYHLVEPIKGIYHELLLPVPDWVERDQAIEAVKEGNKSLQRMLVDFINTAKPECAEALNLAKNGDIHNTEAWLPVMELLEEQIRYPLFNAARGEVGRALLLQAIKTKITIDYQTVEVDLLLRANRLNMNALSTVPAFGVIWCFAKCLSNIRARFAKRLPTSDPSIRCILCLREIHRLFSRLSITRPPDVLVSDAHLTAYLSWLEEHGRVLSSLSLLERSAASMNLRIEIKTALAEDLEGLKAMYAANDIQLSEVDRIWRTYPWIITS